MRCGWRRVAFVGSLLAIVLLLQPATYTGPGRTPPHPPPRTAFPERGAPGGSRAAAAPLLRQPAAPAAVVQQVATPPPRNGSQAADGRPPPPQQRDPLSTAGGPTSTAESAPPPQPAPVHWPPTTIPPNLVPAGRSPRSWIRSVSLIEVWGSGREVLLTAPHGIPLARENCLSRGSTSWSWCAPAVTPTPATTRNGPSPCASSAASARSSRPTRSPRPSPKAWRSRPARPCAASPPPSHGSDNAPVTHSNHALSPPSRSERGPSVGLHAALNLSRILDPNFMAPEDVGPKDRWHAALAVAARKGEWSWPSELARHKALGT